MSNTPTPNQASDLTTHQHDIERHLRGLQRAIVAQIKSNRPELIGKLTKRDIHEIVSRMNVQARICDYIAGAFGNEER